jgi:hypothetical protein
LNPKFSNLNQVPNAVAGRDDFDFEIIGMDNVSPPPEPETQNLNLEPETRNQKPETQNLDLETRNPRPEPQN